MCLCIVGVCGSFPHSYHINLVTLFNYLSKQMWSFKEPLRLSVHSCGFSAANCSYRHVSLANLLLLGELINAEPESFPAEEDVTI